MNEASRRATSRTSQVSLVGPNLAKTIVLGSPHPRVRFHRKQVSDHEINERPLVHEKRQSQLRFSASGMLILNNRKTSQPGPQNKLTSNQIKLTPPNIKGQPESDPEGKP